MAKFAMAMKQAIDALNDIQKELKQTDSSGEKSQKKALKVGEAFKKSFKEAQKSADANFKKIGQCITNGLKSAGKAAADFGKKAVGIAAGAFVALSGAVVGVNAATTEFRENQAKLQTAFESAGGSAETAKNTYNDLYRVLGDNGQATEATAHLAKLTTNQQELSEWTSICQGVYATFGESLPIEGLTEASNETAKVGQVTGNLADALNWAGISEDAFNKQLQACNGEAEREQLIRETLNGVYSDAAAKYEENNQKILAQREAQAELSQTLSTLGEAVAPVITAFMSLANDGLAIIMPYITDFVETYAPMIQPFVQSLAENYLPLLKEGLKQAAEFTGILVSWVVDNWGIIAAVAGVVAGIAAAIGLYNAVAAVKAAMDAAQVATLKALIAAQAAQAAALITAIAPYVAIVAAIAAVIAIIIVCIKHWDDIKAKVAEVWEAIKTFTIESVEKVVSKFNEMKQAIIDRVIAIKDGVVNKFNEIKQGIVDRVNSIKENVVGKFNDIKTGISEKVNAVKESVSNTFDKVKTAITKPIDAAKNGVKTAIDKIKGFFDFEWSLPKIKLPHFSISGEFSLNPPSIPKFGISWYANGGVFDKPTLFPYGNGSIGGLGEAGAEAVVPLEKNTKWLDRIAEKLRGNSQPVILMVDGKVFGEIAVDSINSITAQRGSLPLRIV